MWDQKDTQCINGCVRELLRIYSLSQSTDLRLLEPGVCVHTPTTRNRYSTSTADHTHECRLTDVWVFPSVLSLRIWNEQFRKARRPVPGKQCLLPPLGQRGKLVPIDLVVFSILKFSKIHFDMSYVSLQKQEKLRLMSKTRMSPQGGNFPAETIYILRSAAGQHYNVSFQSEVQGPSAKTLTCHDATGLHSSVNCKCNSALLPEAI